MLLRDWQNQLHGGFETREVFSLVCHRNVFVLLQDSLVTRKKKVMNWKENDDFRKMRGNKICIVWVDLGRKAKFVHSNKREAKDMDTSAHGCWCSARSFVGHLLFAAVLPMKVGVMSSRKSIREMVRNLWGEEKRCELIEKEWGRIGKNYRNIP